MTALGARVGAALAIAGRETAASESGAVDGQALVAAADSMTDEYGSLEKRLADGDELLTRADDDDTPELTLNDILAATDIHRDL